VRAPRALIAATGLFALQACHRGSRVEPPLPLRSALRDSLFAADRARSDASERRGLAASSQSWLDDGAIYLRAGAPIIYGREGVRRLLAAVDVPGAAYYWEPLGGEVAQDRRTGYTYGVAVVVTPTSEAGRSATPNLASSRYIAFWRKGRDGAWRVVAYSDVGSTPVSPDAKLTVTELTGAPTPQPPDRRSAPARAAWAADSAFAFAGDVSGLAIAFSSYAAPLAVLFSGSELVVGPEAIGALYEEQQRPGVTLNWHPVVADASDSGDLAVTVGDYVFTGPSATGVATQRFGKYLTIWKRQRDRSWKYLVDGGSPNPTPAR
jgi:ketosteroid isomerase-like protein